MNLIIKEYLAALKESGELDVVVPDLLFAMGLKVISIPQKGANQGGVDIVAVGTLPEDTKKRVYLLVIKEKDITRAEWAKHGVQDIRPSLLQALEDYIPNRLSGDLKALPIKIILCFGGEFKQALEAQWNGFVRTNSRENITFDKWNGYILANWINGYLLNERILNDEQRKYFRKTLALAELPEEAFSYSAKLINDICDQCPQNLNKKIRALKTLNLVLRIVHSWSREANNLELSLLSAERALLKAWNIVKSHKVIHNKNLSKIYSNYLKLFETWTYVLEEYYEKVSPALKVQHALSRYTGNVVENIIKFFDICGKVAIYGIWNLFFFYIHKDEHYLSKSREIAKVIQEFIRNNPASKSPVYDSHIIDITLALFLLSRFEKCHGFASAWLDSIVNHSSLGYVRGNFFPINNDSYKTVANLILGNEKDKEKYSSASTLYPILAAWAVLLDDGKAYQDIKYIQDNILAHSNFQITYPDTKAEDTIFNEYLSFETGGGTTFSGISIDEDMERYIKKIILAGKKFYDFENLSCINRHPVFHILTFLSARHYRRPLMPQTWLSSSKFWTY